MSSGLFGNDSMKKLKKALSSGRRWTMKKHPVRRMFAVGVVRC